MEQLRDIAIVLRTVAFEERHRVVTALTQSHGRISALARNSIQSRRFGGTLEPFAASDWMFVERRGADLYRLESAEIRRPYEGLRKDFQKLALASVFNELMLKLAPERQACPELFKLHSNALAALEEMESLDGDLALLNGYLAKVLQASGNQPQLHACLGCQSSLKNFITRDLHTMLSCVVADAGWVCPECRTRETRHISKGHWGAGESQSFDRSMLRVTSGALMDFYASLTAPIRQIPALAQAKREEHAELFIFLEALLIYHVPGFDRAPLKSLRFLGIR